LRLRGTLLPSGRYIIAAPVKVTRLAALLFSLARSTCGKLLLCLLPINLALPSLCAQKNAAPPAGVAWQVKGNWQVKDKGAPIRTGDALQPGSLLQPDPVAAQHTVIVLLPDGQRVMYECFTVDDCARGFRVPSLYGDPEPFAVDMLARIRAALIRGERGFSAAAGIHPPLGFPRDEILATLGPDHQVRLEGLATKLPNGRFTCDIRPFDPGHPSQLHLVLEKTGPFITLPLPSTGLYVVTIVDDRNIPRMQLFLAAISPAQEASFKKSFHDAKELLQKWNDDFYGWPTHDFQWAYLESLVVEMQLDVPAAAAPPHSSSPDRVTAEPAFTPKAGSLAGDTDVVLHSGTPGAVIHYTVDYTQPVAASPVYSAPIVIKGSGLTIKAFASAPGKKDSAVVTGIFRIRK
jgi:Fn3 associated